MHISLLCDPTSAVLPLVREIQLKDTERYGGDMGLPSSIFEASGFALGTTFRRES